MAHSGEQDSNNSGEEKRKENPQDGERRGALPGTQHTEIRPSVGGGGR
jgi:hypothetical protein